MSDRTCEACRWWEMWSAVDPDRPIGECRRRSPAVPDDSSMGDFPKTYCDDWCGDWEAKDQS